MTQHMKSFLLIYCIFFSLSIIMSGCCSRRDIMKSDLKSNGLKDNTIFVSRDVKNPPSKSLLSEMKNESGEVIDEALQILESDKIFSYLSNEVNENSQAMEEWINKTKGSQVKLGSLLKEHPNIFCLTVTVQNQGIERAQTRNQKSYKKYNLMWVFLTRENKCMIMASPDYSCASIYGVRADLQEINNLHVTIENIPKYFSVAQTGSHGFIETDDKKILNETPIMNTILDYYCPGRMAGIDSKGTLISFTGKLMDKRRRYSATGIRTTSILNYDGINDQGTQSDCPLNNYGKPYWICSTFVLPTQ